MFRANVKLVLDPGAGARIVDDLSKRTLALTPTEGRILALMAPGTTTAEQLAAAAKGAGLDVEVAQVEALLSRLHSNELIDYTPVPGKEPERVLLPDDVVPAFRSDLGIAPADKGLVLVTDRKKSRSFTLYDFEVHIARLLDGAHKVTEVIERAGRIGIPVTPESLTKFISQMKAYGFIKAPVAPAVPAAAPVDDKATWPNRATWNPEIREMYQSALRQFRQGRPGHAIEYLDALLEIQPDTPEAIDLKARVTKHLESGPVTEVGFEDLHGVDEPMPELVAAAEPLLAKSEPKPIDAPPSRPWAKIEAPKPATSTTPKYEPPKPADEPKPPEAPKPATSTTPKYEPPKPADEPKPIDAPPSRPWAKIETPKPPSSTLSTPKYEPPTKLGDESKPTPSTTLTSPKYEPAKLAADDPALASTLTARKHEPAKPADDAALASTLTSPKYEPAKPVEDPALASTLLSPKYEPPSKSVEPRKPIFPPRASAPAPAPRASAPTPPAESPAPAPRASAPVLQSRPSPPAVAAPPELESKPSPPRPRASAPVLQSKPSPPAPSAPPELESRPSPPVLQPKPSPPPARASAPASPPVLHSTPSPPRPRASAPASPPQLESKPSPPRPRASSPKPAPSAPRSSVLPPPDPSPLASEPTVVLSEDVKGPELSPLASESTAVDVAAAPAAPAAPPPEGAEPVRVRRSAPRPPAPDAEPAADAPPVRRSAPRPAPAAEPAAAPDAGPVPEAPPPVRRTGPRFPQEKEPEPPPRRAPLIIGGVAVVLLGLVVPIPAMSKIAVQLEPTVIALPKIPAGAFGELKVRSGARVDEGAIIATLDVSKQRAEKEELEKAVTRLDLAAARAIDRNNPANLKKAKLAVLKAKGDLAKAQAAAAKVKDKPGSGKAEQDVNRKEVAVERAERAAEAADGLEKARTLKVEANAGRERLAALKAAIDRGYVTAPKTGVFELDQPPPAGAQFDAGSTFGRIVDRALLVKGAPDDAKDPVLILGDRRVALFSVDRRPEGLTVPFDDGVKPGPAVLEVARGYRPWPMVVFSR